MGRILNDVEIKFLRSCKKAVREATKGAAKEIKKDFKARVFDQAVDDYYEDYSPTKYKRTEKLYKAFKVYATSDGNNINLSWKWDFNWLPQYRSKSGLHQSGDEWIGRDDPRFDPESSDNGIPEKGWIFTNFMEGIHPRFYVVKELSELLGEAIVVNDSYQFEPSYIRIRDYKNQYIQDGRAKEILLKHLKAQYANFN